MSTYRRAPDLGIVTSYFNPCGFRSRAENFERFVEPIRAAGIPLVIVEGCFESGARLAEHHHSLRVPARDVMWQKERLLDLGTGWLPPECTKVAWVDADVLFEDGDWALRTSEKLESALVVQPFSEVVRMSRETLVPRPGDDTFESFGAVFETRPDALAHGKFERHGHTGFAWAANRNLMARFGFYDACIAGSGDHMMAHAFAGDWESPCIGRMVGRGGRHLAHYRKWSRRLHEELRARLSFVPGRLLHLWHGTVENRRYAQRNKELHALAFDPNVDIRVAKSGAWEWASDRSDLHAWARRYFEERKEDEDDMA